MRKHKNLWLVGGLAVLLFYSCVAPDPKTQDWGSAAPGPFRFEWRLVNEQSETNSIGCDHKFLLIKSYKNKVGVIEKLYFFVDNGVKTLVLITKNSKNNNSYDVVFYKSKISTVYGFSSKAEEFGYRLEGDNLILFFKKYTRTFSLKCDLEQ